MCREGMLYVMRGAFEMVEPIADNALNGTCEVCIHDHLCFCVTVHGEEFMLCTKCLRHVSYELWYLHCSKGGE